MPISPFATGRVVGGTTLPIIPLFIGTPVAGILATAPTGKVATGKGVTGKVESGTGVTVALATGC